MSHYHKEAGIASGVIRRDKMLEKYRKIVSEKGIDEALKLCCKERYLAGYRANERKYNGKTFK